MHPQKTLLALLSVSEHNKQAAIVASGIELLLSTQADWGVPLGYYSRNINHWQPVNAYKFWNMNVLEVFVVEYIHGLYPDCGF